MREMNCSASITPSAFVRHSIPLFISIKGAGRWFYGVSGIVALAVLLASLVILGGNFIRELKKRLHTK